MNIDIGVAAQVVAQGLGVLALLLGLWSQRRQGDVQIRTMRDVIKALSANRDTRRRGRRDRAVVRKDQSRYRRGHHG